MPVDLMFYYTYLRVEDPLKKPPLDVYETKGIVIGL